MGSRRKMDALWEDVERRLAALVADACADAGEGVMTREDADVLCDVITAIEKKSPGFVPQVEAAVARRRSRRRTG